MDAKLVVLRGADPTEIELFLPFLIGRSADAALKIPHERVSREHCRIYEFDGELAVRDLGSRNGTFVNGQQIDRPTFLSPGDELTVGGITMRAEYDIRRQVVLEPYDQASETLLASDDARTVAQPAKPKAKARQPAQEVNSHAPSKQPTTKANGKQSKATSQRSKQRDAAVSDQLTIPALETPKPTVAAIPELNVDDRPAPIVDKVELETDESVPLVSEDELEDFLGDLG